MRQPPLADSPPTTHAPFRGPDDTLRLMVQLALGDRGERSVLVRSLKDSIVREIQPKDYLGEILAVRNFAAEKVRYSNDATGVEQVQDPQRTVEQILEYGKAVGDCFPEGTLLWGEGNRFVKIEDVRVGDKIWGLDKWSVVEGKADKGMLPVSLVRLNNGSEVPLTKDHKMYVLRCKEHGHRVGGDWNMSGKCSCPKENRETIRIPVSELVPGMVVDTPERLPFGDDEWAPELSYVDGLYVADGWCDPSKGEFCISGQDGCPKEAQKREVQSICALTGSYSRWNRKSLAIKDSEWFARMSRMGHYAPEKHFLSLNLDEACAAEALRGVMADSGANTHGNGRTFTSTSRELTCQVRVLHKMFGVTCSTRYIVNHGGLGKNPIWRLGVRSRREVGTEKLLRVKQVDHDVLMRPCWDIQTDDHKVYLPEHDVTVSNCDDVATFIGALCRQLGREVEFVVVGFGAPGNYSHVFTRVKEPKTGQWIVCDPVAGTDEAGMLRKVKTWKSVKVDL
jgi:hypothetical protein